MGNSALRGGVCKTGAVARHAGMESGRRSLSKNGGLTCSVAGHEPHSFRLGLAHLISGLLKRCQ